MTVRVVAEANEATEQITAIYLRVTKEESVKTDLSLPNQRNRAIELCDQRGWSTVKVYQEPRHVGGDLGPERRPALAALLADVKAGRVRRIFVRHTDRLWRSTQVEDVILRELQQHSVELWDFSGHKEHRSAGGRFALKVLGAAAELEKNLTGERIREMKRGKAKAGRVAGGPPPFGYTSQSRIKADLLAEGHSEDEAHRLACEKHPVAKAWSIDESEAGVVRLIFDLYIDSRWGGRRISQELNQRGHRRRGGFIWSPVKVGKVVNNPVHAGYSSYDDEAYEKGLPSSKPRFRQTLFEGRHAAIVSKERWHEAQRIKIEENSQKGTRGVGRVRSYPLSGIIQCGKCGTAMTGKSTSAKNVWGYYMCGRRKYYGTRDGCDGPTMKAEWAETAVLEYLAEVVSTPSVVHAIFERVSSRLSKGAPDLQRKLSEAVRRRDELQQKRQRWMSRYEEVKDDADAELIWDRIRQLKSEFEAAEHDVAALRSRTASDDRPRITEKQVAAHLARLAKLGDKGDVPTKQRNLVMAFQRGHALSIRVVGKGRMEASLRFHPMQLTVVVPGAHEASKARPAAEGHSQSAPSRKGRKRDATSELVADENGQILKDLVVREALGLDEWVKLEQARAPQCACGCGEVVRVLRNHRQHGVPKFRHGHHDNPIRREFARIREEGYLLPNEAARELGVSATTLRRWDSAGKVQVRRVPMFGGRTVRVFDRNELLALSMSLATARDPQSRLA